MKRWIALGVCAVLIMTSGLILSGRKGIAVGRGSGRSAKIETIEEFFDFAEFVSSRGDMSLAPVAMTEEDDEETKPEYTSLTFTEVSSIFEDMVSFQRELTGYMTEDAVLYHSDGSITISDPSNSDLSLSFSFNLDIYFGKEECYARFHHFLVVANANTMNFPDEWKDVWISFNGEEWDELRSAIDFVNNSNYSVLNKLGDLLEVYSEGGFRQSEKVFLLVEDKFRSVMSDFGLGRITEGSFEINLEDAANPKISILAPDFSDIISFSDINNTVVELQKDFSPKDASDLNDYFNNGGF